VVGEKSATIPSPQAPGKPMVDWAMDCSTVSLIGMPGAGKSTVGVLLAKQLGLNFVDTDLLIQVDQGEPLQQSVDRLGFDAFCELEESVVMAMPLDRYLVATGGSVVSSDTAMARLRAGGPVVYLEVSLPELETRIEARPDRGIAFAPGQTLSDIFQKRQPLYQQFADLSLSCEAQSAEATATLIADWLRSR
jgi:shikimate kinase